MTHRDIDRLMRQLIAGSAAAPTSSRDRQVIAVAEAYISGDIDRADALAREHLADYPDSVLATWITERKSS